MTNEELIRRFFLGGIRRGDEESYGFYVASSYSKSPLNMSLYSKTLNTPIINRASENYFIIAPSDQTTRDMVFAVNPESSGIPSWKRHILEAHKIAKQLRIKAVFSPNANPAHFQKYMEKKINCNLLALANDLNAGSYASILRFTEVGFPKPTFDLADGPDSCFAVPENYQRLMEDIETLLEGERILGLPKHQVALIDTDEVQSMWRWLIKENPVKEDQELLRKTYTLSRLMAPQQKRVRGGLIPNKFG